MPITYCCGLSSAARVLSSTFCSPSGTCRTPPSGPPPHPTPSAHTPTVSTRERRRREEHPASVPLRSFGLLRIDRSGVRRRLAGRRRPMAARPPLDSALQGRSRDTRGGTQGILEGDSRGTRGGTQGGSRTHRKAFYGLGRGVDHHVHFRPARLTLLLHGAARRAALTARCHALR
jgi:hypothetical protein